MSKTPETEGSLRANPFRTQQGPIIIDLTIEDESAEAPGRKDARKQERFLSSDDHLPAKLYQYFGYSHFQDKLQWLAVREIVKRKHDVFISMPPGLGRSLCYQLPALLLGNRITVVLCPQPIDTLHHISQLRQLHICAESVDEAMSIVELDRVLSDLCSAAPATRLLYLTVSHAVDSQSCCHMLQSLQRRQLLAQFVVEQAHCASKWSEAFRPEYLQLGRLHAMFASVPWLALTDTAVPQHVEAGIVRQLRLQRPVRWFKERPHLRGNLYYDVVFKALIADRLGHLAEYVRRCLGCADRHGRASRNPCGIIYCGSSDAVDQVAANLSQLGIPARAYHSALSDREQQRTRIDWLDGRFSVLCTETSGDTDFERASIRVVIHWDVPHSLAAYYRQTGQAGHDGRLSFCRIYYRRQETPYSARDDAELTDRVILDFRQMITYCETFACRQRRFSEYFGYWHRDCRRMCDVCSEPWAAEAALVAFQRMERDAVAVERRWSRNGRHVESSDDCDEIGSMDEQLRWSANEEELSSGDSPHSSLESRNWGAAEQGIASLIESQHTVSRANSRVRDFDDFDVVGDIDVTKGRSMKPLRRRHGRPRAARSSSTTESERSVRSRCDRERSRSPLSGRDLNRCIATVNLISSSDSDDRSPVDSRGIILVASSESSTGSVHSVAGNPSDKALRARRRDRQRRVSPNRPRSPSCSPDTVSSHPHWFQHCDRQRSRSPLGDSVDLGDRQVGASAQPAGGSEMALLDDNDDQERSCDDMNRLIDTQQPIDENDTRSLAQRIEAEQQRIEQCVLSSLQPYHNANRIVPPYLAPFVVQRIAKRFERCDSRASEIEAYVDRIFVRLPQVRSIRDIDESEFM